MTPLQQIDDQLAHECYAAARAALNALEPSPSQQARLALIALQLRQGNPFEALRSAEAAAEQLAGSERCVALEIALQAALRCRLPRCAERLIEQLSAADPDPAGTRTAAAQGRYALTFDERERAREVLAAADPSSLPVRRHLAELAYIEGNFAYTLELIGDVLERSDVNADTAPALRLIADCHGSVGAHGDEASALQRLLELLPNGASAGHDRLKLAFAHASAGDYELAAGELQRLWASDPEGGLGSYARRRLDHLEAPPAQGTGARRLEQFPTTHQKRNFCGPAVLELCLRYLGIELSQDEIAGVVKRESGTPMYEISAFLAARGIAARRIEATPQRLRAASDLGLPVIVQEEYSTTSHVAVITGYDGRLGTFIAQDPMTHRHEFKAFEWTERAGELFGNGAVLVIGRAGAVSGELLSALDAAGLVERAHLVMLDEADRRRAAHDGESEDALAQEVLDAAQRALREAEEYPLAWSRCAWAQYALWRAHDGTRTRGEFLETLQRVRSRFRGSEWAHRLHARYLYVDERYREAYVELLQAHRADPHDGSNLDGMGDCLRRVGDLADAEQRFADALECEPTQRNAVVNLAALYVGQLTAASQGEFYGEVECWVAAPVRDRADQPLAHPLSEVERRARWYVELLLDEAPDHAETLLQSGLLEALAGDFTGAERSFERVAEENDSLWLRSLQTRAAWLGRASNPGAFDRCLAHLHELHPTSASTWLWLAQRARDQRDFAGAFAALCEGAQRVGSERVLLEEALWEAGRQLGGDEAAAVRLRDLIERTPHDPEFVRALAARVEDAGQRGIAIALLRTAIELAPGDLALRYRLGSLLSLDPTTRDEAEEVLLEVVRLAPNLPDARLVLAWTYLETDPAEGLTVLEPCLDQATPELLETAGVLAIASGDDELGRELRERALGAYETPELARMALATYHIRDDRYELAAELMLPIRTWDAGEYARDMQVLVLSSARLSGRHMEVLDWVRALAAGEVPEHLADEVYWAYNTVDLELAARACDVRARCADDPQDALEARIEAAGCRAELGDTSELDALSSELGDNGPAWANVYHACHSAGLYERAAEAARRAHHFAPFDLQALSAWERYTLSLGDKRTAFEAARAALEHHPYQHLGDERLAMHYAHSLQAERALAHSLRAVGLAPFCHIAHTARALALFVAGDLERAEAHMLHARKLESEQPDEWTEPNALYCAFAGDSAGLEALFVKRADDRQSWPFPEFDAALRELCELRAAEH